MLSRTAVVAVSLAVLAAGCASSDQVAPVCTDEGLDTMVLLAQAVPEATLVPCIETLPAGWTLSGMDIESGQGRIWFDSDRAGIGALEVRLKDRCSVSTSVEVPSDEDGTRRYELVASLAPGFSETRSYVFEGGCVTYQFEFPEEGWSALSNDASTALSFMARRDLAELLADRTDGLVSTP